MNVETSSLLSSAEPRKLAIFSQTPEEWGSSSDQTLSLKILGMSSHV